MRQLAAGFLLLIATAAAHAQMTPVGVWTTVNDETGKEQSHVRIVDSGGVISGKIVKLLAPDKPDPVCDKCTDDRKDKPILGLSIIEGLKKNGEVWEGGQILDPNNGKVYKVKLIPIEDGKKLQVRGYVGPFFRTQTWLRVE
jgi:uncharacterized protein (DUF2147 family)